MMAYTQESREKKRAYYLANKEAILKRNGSYRKQNPHRYKKLSREYRRAQSPRISTRKKASKYGLLIEDTELLLSAPHCEICGTDKPGGPRDIKWRIDHCHKSGRVRGALCNSCNWVLGHAKDDPSILRRAADYLDERT